MEASFKSGSFAHAYLFCGERERAIQDMERMAIVLLSFGKDDLIAHPDFHREKFEKFGIKDAQEIKKKSYGKKLIGKRKIFFLEVDNFSREAENALLKICEEPPPEVYFLIFTPNSNNVSGVLKSRFVIIKADSKKNLLVESGGQSEINDFFNMGAVDKDIFLEKLKKTKDKDKIKNLFLVMIEYLERELKTVARDLNKLKRTALKIERLEKGVKMLEQNMPAGLVLSLIIF